MRTEECEDVVAAEWISKRVFFRLLEGMRPSAHTPETPIIETRSARMYGKKYVHGKVCWETSVNKGVSHPFSEGFASRREQRRLEDV
jgi:hypothetical protein